MEKHVFEAARKLEDIIDGLEDGKLYESLADVHSQLLLVGKYLNKEKFIEHDTISLTSHGDIRAYDRITVIYKYDNGSSLVEDTAGKLYLLPTKIIE